MSTNFIKVNCEVLFQSKQEAIIKPYYSIASLFTIIPFDYEIEEDDDENEEEEKEQKPKRELDEVDKVIKEVILINLRHIIYNETFLKELDKCKCNCNYKCKMFS